MAHFEDDEPEDALSALREAIHDDSYGRRTTALKRAVTIVDREPRLATWSTWVYDAVNEADLALDLSREQLLAFMRLSRDFPAALNKVIESYTSQPYTQPKAILLSVLAGLSRHDSDDVRNLASSAIGKISELNDAVLNIALKHLPN